MKELPKTNKLSTLDYSCHGHTETHGETGNYEEYEEHYDGCNSITNNVGGCTPATALDMILKAAARRSSLLNNAAYSEDGCYAEHSEHHDWAESPHTESSRYSEWA